MHPGPVFPPTADPDYWSEAEFFEAHFGIAVEQASERERAAHRSARETNAPRAAATAGVLSHHETRS